ncbi:MAG TPA: NAD-dependent epimerase/dehydratase family protein, partial [Opitutaceae bacterium]|nr:NAD-dependent epimerase/dehydratase family protein [Opitutaceae bacterium]
MRLFIAGHQGMVGAALVRRFRQEPGVTLLLKSREEGLDLTRQASVDAFYAATRPDTAIIAAARVGGIYANNTYPADFIFSNLAIASNTLEGAYRHGVKRVLFLGSSCIYPKLAPQPMPEESLLTGPLEPTNEAYAVAKI